MEMPEQQQKIDYSRAEQLAILRRAVLPETRGLARAVVKGVLRCIDDHARRDGQCWASQETLAEEANCSLRQIERAVAVLVKLSLITKERQKIGRGRMTQNFHRIAWTELELLCPLPKRDQPATDGGLIKIDQPARCADQPARYDDQPAMGGGFLGSALSANKNRLPLTPSKEWQQVEEEFLEKGFGTVTEFAAAARAVGDLPHQFSQRVQELLAIASHPANRKHVSSPFGIVAWHMAKGVWPDQRILGRAELDRLDAKRETVERLQGMKLKLHRIVKECRVRGFDELVIKAKLREFLPHEFCVSENW